MSKIDNHGKITIPSHIRKQFNLRQGMKMQIKTEGDKIILKPYNYECKNCKAQIPDGTENSLCDKCIEEKTVKIY